MSKPLPKLSPAQAEAWGRVLVWHKEYPNSPGFTINNRRDAALHYDWVSGTANTFNALVRRGVLVNMQPRFIGYPRYAIHPDYLPQEDTQS